MLYNIYVFITVMELFLSETMTGNNVVETERKLRSLTKSSDIREDMAIVMAPHSNWEEYLMPAPISIAIIG